MTAAGLKLLGGLLLAAAGGLLGWQQCAEKHRTARLLRALAADLGVMAAELTVRRALLPQIFERLRDRPFFELLSAAFGTEPMDALWARAARSLPLPEGDREALASLSAAVGRYDAARQAAEIEAVRLRLAADAEELERFVAARGRSFAGLGASLGAMAAVILF